MYEIYAKTRFPVELLVSIAIFSLLVYSGDIFKTVCFEDVVYAILSFIVILELVKMLGQYIFDRRFHVNILLDTFFVFTLRETILIYTNKDVESTINLLQMESTMISINEKVFYICLGIVIMFFLAYFRKRGPNRQEIVCVDDRRHKA